MYNSLRTEKHRMAFSNCNLEHPSKAFVDSMINEHTSTELKNCILQEGYNADDMRKKLFHLKDNGWIKEFLWQKQKKLDPINFFCSEVRHISESYSICDQFNLQYESKSKRANG